LFWRKHSDLEGFNVFLAFPAKEEA
jgi:hypothetical protein